MNTSMEHDQSVVSPRNLQQSMRQHPLFFFFLIAYAFSWVMSVPFILSQWNILPDSKFYQIFFIIKSFGPALAAYVMCRVTEGSSGSNNLKSRIKQWQVGWKWYVIILLGVPTAMLFGIIALPGALGSFQGFPPHFLLSYLIGFVVIFFGGGPLGEEPGWRGFALPRMQSRYGVLKANLLLGILWTSWHLPDFLTVAQKGGPGTGLSALYGLPVFFLEVMALTIIFTWVFNHTSGSVFIALLLHASYNTFGNAVQPLFSAPIVTGTDLPFMVGIVVPALLLLFLTRGKLGYQPVDG
jgi:uncharacterized protein